MRAGRMPFEERGPRRPLDRTTVDWADELRRAADARHIVITPGTPSSSHIETDLRDIRGVHGCLLAHLRACRAPTLRSTIAPRTDEFVAGYL